MEGRRSGLQGLIEFDPFNGRRLGEVIARILPSYNHPEVLFHAKVHNLYLRTNDAGAGIKCDKPCLHQPCLRQLVQQRIV